MLTGQHWGIELQRRRDLAACKPNVRQYSADGCPADQKEVEIDPDAAYETAGTCFSMSTGGGGTGESSARVLTTAVEIAQRAAAKLQ